MIEIGLKSLGDLTAGQMIILLQIAGTQEAVKATAIVSQAAGGLTHPTQQDKLTLVMRGLARRDADRYALTTRGQWIGTAIIAATMRAAGVSRIIETVKAGS